MMRFLSATAARNKALKFDHTLVVHNSDDLVIQIRNACVHGKTSLTFKNNNPKVLVSLMNKLIKYGYAVTMLNSNVINISWE